MLAICIIHKTHTHTHSQETGEKRREVGLHFLLAIPAGYGRGTVRGRKGKREGQVEAAAALLAIYFMNANPCSFGFGLLTCGHPHTHTKK